MIPNLLPTNIIAIKNNERPILIARDFTTDSELSGLFIM